MHGPVSDGFPVGAAWTAGFRTRAGGNAGQLGLWCVAEDDLAWVVIMRGTGRSEGQRGLGLGRRMGVLIAAAFVVAGCLGQDFKSIELSLNEWASGWQATVEPDEEFYVGLRPVRMHPDARWRLVAADASVVELADQSVVEAEVVPEEPGEWVFRFRAVALGGSPLTFEALAGGVRVAIAEYSVSVVEDACAAGVGVTAARCKAPMSTSRRPCERCCRMCARRPSSAHAPSTAGPSTSGPRWAFSVQAGSQAPDRAGPLLPASVQALRLRVADVHRHRAAARGRWLPFVVEPESQDTADVDDDVVRLVVG